jgi:hypothetical protein
MNKYTANTFTCPDTGETIMEIPQELLQKMNWGEGTEVKFNVEPTTGVIVMSRAKHLQKFAVETVSTFRHVYIIECESAEHALDTVACEEAQHYLQSHAGEQVLYARPVKNSDIVTLYRETEDPNMTLEKLEGGHYLNIVHKVDYSK